MSKFNKNDWLVNIIKSYKGAYISIFIFSAIINILILAPAWYMLQVYDRVLTSFDENTLLGLSLIVLFLFLIYGILDRYRRLILVSSTEGLDEKILEKIKSKFVHGDYKTTKKLKNSFYDLNQIKQFLTGQAILSFIDAPWFFIYILVIFLIHFHLGLIALVSAIILFILAIINQKMSGSKFDNASKSMTDENRFIDNIVNSAESSHVMGMNKDLFERLVNSREDSLNNMYHANKDSAWINSLTRFFRILVQSLILGYAAYLAINEQISFGMIIAASILLGRTLAPLEGVINNWKQYLSFKKSFFRLNETYKNSPDNYQNIDLGKPEGIIETKNIHYNIGKDNFDTIKKIDLKIIPGESLVIVGPSGAGKTTLLKTLCGIYKPHKGEITLDGGHLEKRDKSKIGEYFGYLSQSNILLEGKISENICRFGEIDDKEVIEASKKANIHNFIVNLQNGYETELGNFGSGLSDGESRRIAIARAIYRNPKILFLDEPNLSLDNESLVSLIGLINNFKQNNKTLVYTTHVPDLASLADKALLLIKGEIKAYGNTKEIIPHLKGKK